MKRKAINVCYLTENVFTSKINYLLKTKKLFGNWKGGL